MQAIIYHQSNMLLLNLEKINKEITIETIEEEIDAI